MAHLAKPPSVCTITLTKELVAYVDEIDFENVSKFKWYADCGPWANYAKTDQIIGRPRMHVFIMKPPTGLIVHHKDRNGLHNWRDNLEVATQSLNSRFNALRVTKTGSKYRGVYFHKQRGKFAAEITVNYKKKYLGLFVTQEEAALAYNNAAKEIFGDNCLLNEIKNA